MRLKPFTKELRESNLVRYKGVSPSIDKVNEVIKKSNLTRNSFEITFGIVLKTIERYVYGYRGLPVVYWHIFYEFDNLEKFYDTFKVKKRRIRKNKKEELPPIQTPENNKNLIDAYRTRIGQQ